MKSRQRLLQRATQQAYKLNASDLCKQEKQRILASGRQLRPWKGVASPSMHHPACDSKSLQRRDEVLHKATPPAALITALAPLASAKFDLVQVVRRISEWPATLLLVFSRRQMSHWLASTAFTSFKTNKKVVTVVGCPCQVNGRFQSLLQARAPCWSERNGCRLAAGLLKAASCGAASS